MARRTHEEMRGIRLAIAIFLTPAVLAVVLLAGAALPDALIGDGTEAYSGSERERAEDFFRVAHANFVGTPDTFPVTTVSIREVYECPSSWPAGEVRLYTYFALPYGEGTVTCGGSIWW